MNFTKLLRTTFLQNTSERLILILFYWPSPVAASDSLRGPTSNFVTKEIPSNFLRTSFDRTSLEDWLLLKFICEFWEVFQNTSITEHLWETAYFMYKLQNFNQKIQWKTISQVFFMYFRQKREVAILRRSFT